MNHTTFIVRVFEAAEVLPSDDLVKLLRTMLSYLERRFPALPELSPDPMAVAPITANRDHKGAASIRPDDDSEGRFIEGWESLYS